MMRRLPATRRPGYQLAPFPRSQDQIIDWLDIAARRHTMHALLDVDITDSRRAIRDERARTGEPLSLTAFVIACFAHALGENLQMQAVRRGRRQLAIFTAVDVAMGVENTVDGSDIPVPHVIRSAHRKGAATITRELRRAVVEPEPYRSIRRFLPMWLILPRFVRRLVWTRLLAEPARRRRLIGTTFVTALGMFGSRAGWAIPQALNYPVGLTIGGLARRPVVAHSDSSSQSIENHEFLSLTISFDHDLIDGAPAARFTAQFADLLESGWGLGRIGLEQRSEDGPGAPHGSTFDRTVSGDRRS